MPSKSLATLNNGWPFGDGPMGRHVRFEARPHLCVMGCHIIPPGHHDVFLTCPDCPQVIHKLTDDEGCPWTVSLDLLKTRITDHALKCHADQIAADTYC